MNKPYQRVLLKLSGKVFGGGKLGVDPVIVSGVAKEITVVVSGGTQVTMMVGGGNYSRGAELSSNSMARDRTGCTDMLGAAMNAVALQDFLEKEEIHTRVRSVINITQMAEPCIPRRAECHLEKGHPVIFKAGSRMPYFFTDTVAVQHALEISAEVLLMGRQGVNGVYDSDPRTNPGTGRYERLTHDELLSRNLKVADATATALAHDNALNIIFFNLSKRSNIGRVVQDEPIGTFISR